MRDSEPVERVCLEIGLAGLSIDDDTERDVADESPATGAAVFAEEERQLRDAAGIETVFVETVESEQVLPHPRRLEIEDAHPDRRGCAGDGTAKAESRGRRLPAGEVRRLFWPLTDSRVDPAHRRLEVVDPVLERSPGRRDGAAGFCAGVVREERHESRGKGHGLRVRNNHASRSKIVADGGQPPFSLRTKSTWTS